MFSLSSRLSHLISPILDGVLVPLHFGWGRTKMIYPLTLDIHPIDLKLETKIKLFKKFPEGFVHCSNFADVSTFQR